MKQIKVLFFVCAVALSIASCDSPPLENDPPGTAESLSNMQNSFVKATNGITPNGMKKNEWALFRISAKLYTGEFQGMGYKASQVLETKDGSVTIENNNYDTKDLTIVNTDYSEPKAGEEPPISLQKQWDCKFIKPPYYLWYSECQLPPEQNFWIFSSITEPTTPIFFGLTKYTKKEKLPQILIDEGRCYGLENCEINVNYLEYDMIGEDSNGETKRVHYVTSFSGELPYLASNLKTCYSTLIEIQGNKHPAQICQELVNFKPGE